AAHELIELQETFGEDDVVAADTAAFEEEEERGVVIAAEGLDEHRQYVQDGLAAMLRLGHAGADRLIEAAPRLVEDRLQQAALSAEVANQLRFRAPRLAGDGRRRRLFVAEAAEKRFAGSEKA